MANLGIYSGAGPADLIGGFAQGFVNAKNSAKDRALNEEYKKIAMENVKATAKLHEAQIKKLDMEGGLLNWAINGVANPSAMPPQSGGTPAPPQFQPQSFQQMGGAQGQPQPQAAQMTLPETIAQGVITIPGDPSGNISVRQNNPFNLKHVGQEGSQGAGTRGFAIFNSPEEGVQAGLRQLQLDQSRGLTYGQFAEKYAPAYENPTWKADVSKALGGISDNTPISQIPLQNLATVIAKRESSTDISPIFQGQMTQAQSQAPQLNQFSQPQRGLITPQKFLEGYMKKNYGVEPDEVTVSTYGDHKLITDKKKGTPLFIIAGQGKTEMVDVTMPDGSVIKRPMVVPPSPLPGGIPVINMAGAATNALGPGGAQTKPPEYKWDEVTSPGGGKKKVATPIAQPGMSYETEPPGIKIGDVGKTNQIMQASERLNEVNKLIFPEGKIDRGLLFKARTPMGGIGEGAKLYSKMYQVIDAALRLETGAQATPGEIEVKMREFWPNPTDTESVIKEKNKDLNQYFDRLRKLQDPTGQIGQMGGIKLQVPKGGLNQKPKTWEELKRGLVGGQ